MKILSGLFALILVSLVLCFALSNQQGVTVEMWPFDGAWQMPLSMVGLVPLISGLFLGGLIGWLASIPHRMRVRRLNKELHALNDKIDDLQKSAVAQQTSSIKKKYFWERKI